MHSDCGGSKGVVWREDQGAPVLAVVIWSIWWSGEDVVPFEDVRLRGVGDDVWWRVLGDGFVFAG